MAIIHDATITPDKLTFARDWLAKQPWAAGVTVTERIGGYRFDDPQGQVGVEFLLFAGGDRTAHLPFTYRAEPLAGADEFLVATIEHSVLGTRYVYDGLADPVAVQALLTAVLTGGEQEALEFHSRNGTVEQRAPVVFAKGSGARTADEVPEIVGVSIERDDAIAVISTGGFELTLKRLLDGVPVAGDETLEVSWPQGRGVLVGVSRLENAE